MGLQIKFVLLIITIILQVKVTTVGQAQFDNMILL